MLLDLVQHYRLVGVKRLSVMKFDVAAAYGRVKVATEDRPLLGFQHNNKTYQYRTLPFGYRLSSFHWGRLTGKIFCHAKVLCGLILPNLAGKLFVDDGIFLSSEQDPFMLAAVVLLALRLFGVPAAHHKTTTSSVFE